MARKKKSTPQVQVEQGEFFCASDAAWGGFVNIRLSDDQKTKFKDWWEERANEVPDIIGEFLAEGGKVAYTFDRSNQCFIVTFTGALMGNSQDRFAATSRAGTLDEACALMAWKHGYLAEGDYGNYRPLTGEMQAWG